MPRTHPATVERVSPDDAPTIAQDHSAVAMATSAAHATVKQEEGAPVAMNSITPRQPVLGTPEQDELIVSQLVAIQKPLPIDFGSLRASKRKTKERDETTDADALVDRVVVPLKKAKLTPASDAHAQEELPERDTKTQYAPARKTKRSKAKSASTRKETLVNTSSHPDWYEKVSPKASFSRGDVQKLAHTRTLIQHCIEAHNRGDQQALDKAIVELTEQLHEIEFYPFLSMVEVKKSNVLGSGGLYLIFGAEPGHQHVFPSHLRADAEVLYSRWFMGDLEPSLLRGLVTLKSTKEDGKTRNYNSGIIEEYSFQKSARVFGDNGLRNGQWFANRLCAMRDGAHAELEPGICGQKDKGAFSIVLANGGYADEDKGDTIHYCGTQSKTPAPTYRTQLLLDSLRVGNPIRVLRSKSKSQFAPKEGIRFDGIYKIVSKEILDEDTAMYRFELHREAGQDPIRYQGAGARPTSQELLQLKKINDLLK